MFEHCLYFNTTSLARQLEREWSSAFKAFDLTPPQAFMLRIILEKEPISYSDLANAMNITKATCSRTVKGLIAFDLIKRTQTDSDGRSFVLVSTAKAESIRHPLNQASAEVTKKIKRIIGQEQFDLTVASLKAITASIE